MGNKLHSFFTPNALAYTWRQLAQRAGATDGDPNGSGFEILNIPLFYGYPDQFSADKPGIIIAPAPLEAWQNLITRPHHSLDWFPQDKIMPTGATFPFDNSIPVLFWGQGYEDGNKPFVEQCKDGSIIFYADIIAATFFMLSRWEETIIIDRDLHDRFPATASVAYKQGFLDRPIVDEYALILREWINVLLPRWEPKPRRFTVKLSHDIDYIQRFDSTYHGVRTVGHYLLKKRNMRYVVNALTDLVARCVVPTKNSALQGIYHLARLSHQYEFDSAFYFQASPPGLFDSGYNPADPLLQPVLAQLQNGNFELGFHPGYHTYESRQNFMQEKGQLEQALGVTLQGGRQHYLRFRVPDTWRLWEAANLTYDSTLGYADHEGFRAGTCYPYHPFDVEQDRPLYLLEIPLIVMERTLHQYRFLSAEVSFQRIITLAQRCQTVGGIFTLLWHNTSFTETWQPWAKIYPSVLAALHSLVSS